MTQQFVKLCDCGCGQPTRIARHTYTRDGVRAGQPMRFARGHRSHSRPQYICNPATGCWEWQWHKNPKGYGCLTRNYKTLAAHRVYYETHVGPIPEGLCVLHRCDNPACVNPEHLFLGTIIDNSNDKVAKGRQSRGETHYTHTTPGAVRRGEQLPQAKLTEELVRRIRAEKTTGLLNRELAARYSVSRSLIDQIISRRIWRHVA